MFGSELMSPTGSQDPTSKLSAVTLASLAGLRGRRRPVATDFALSVSPRVSRRAQQAKGAATDDVRRGTVQVVNRSGRLVGLFRHP